MDPNGVKIAEPALHSAGATVSHSAACKPRSDRNQCSATMPGFSSLHSVQVQSVHHIV